MTPVTSHFVGDLTWDAVRDRLAAGAPAILPIGAGSKQHGFHLPLATDEIQAKWFASHAARQSGGLIWPVLTYGTYPAFTAYAGSVSLRTETFEAVMQDIIEALLGQTHGRVIVINTGISTMTPVVQVIARCSDPNRAIHVPLYLGKHFMDAKTCCQQQSYGGHADEIETSIMLALAPDMADMRRATASPPVPGGPQPGPLTPDDPTSPNYSPSGSFGDPSLATAEKGARLIAAIVRDIDEACASALRT